MSLALLRIETNVLWVAPSECYCTRIVAFLRGVHKINGVADTVSADKFVRVFGFEDADLGETGVINFLAVSMPQAVGDNGRLLVGVSDETPDKAVHNPKGQIPGQRRTLQVGTSNFFFAIFYDDETLPKVHIKLKGCV